ncbi:hypothetical protein ES706_04792 [subsurface metagenome]
MKSEPLYPHVPKRGEPLYPHVPKAKAITLEVPKELETLAQEARKYKSAEEWRKFDSGKEISKVLIGGRGLLPSGTDINYLEKLEALRKWGGDKSDIEIVSAFYNQVTKGEVTEVTPEREVMGASPEAEIDQIIADLNLLREERVWIDTFKIKGASVIHVQTGDTATIIEPPEDFTSPNYADRAMQIKWADGSEMVVDSNDFAPSSLQKQIAEITHGKPIPKFPTANAAKERRQPDSKVIEPFNIHLRAFWEDDMGNVEKLIRKLDTNTLKKLYGMTIEVTPGQFFSHPRTGEPMLGDTRYFHGKPYLILLGTKPSPRVVYHEIAHAIGIEDEELAMKFAIEQEARLKSRGVTPTAEAAKERRHVVLESGKTLSWDAWLRELQGYQRRGETLPKVEYPRLKCKYCGTPVPEYVLKGRSVGVEIWAGYHVKGHREAVRELAEKKLPWSAGLIPIE